MFSLLSCISLLLYRKRELFILSKSFLLSRANDISSFNGLSEAVFCIMSLLFGNKALESAVSYRIIKLVILLLITLGVTSYFCGKDVTDFLKTWDNFAKD